MCKFTEFTAFCHLSSLLHLHLFFSFLSSSLFLCSWHPKTIPLALFSVIKCLFCFNFGSSILFFPPSQNSPSSTELIETFSQFSFIYLFIFPSRVVLGLLFIYLLFHTLKWNSHGFTCVPHPDPPSHLPLHPLPLGFPIAPGLSACLMHPTWAGDLFHPR